MLRRSRTRRSKSKTRKGSRDAEPGDYAVILDPYATADLVEMLAFDGMGALAVQEGRSWMNGAVWAANHGEEVHILTTAEPERSTDAA